MADIDALPHGLSPVVADALVQAPDRYNIGKGKPATVIAADAVGALVVTDMIWGLVPRWSKEPATPYTTVTARLDRAPKSRIFASAWQQRHCIVPMSGYYKWDRQRKPPWPHFIQDKTGITLLAAGLWERWENEEGAWLLSFSLLTDANPAIPPPLTQDGPVFLEPRNALKWLAGGFSSPRSLRRNALLPRLESYTVGRRIRDAEVDSYTLLEPVDPEVELAVPAAPEDAGEDEWDGEDD